MRDGREMNDRLDADEREAEAMLASLRPAPAVNRDALMYAAGVRSGRIRLNAWRGLAAVLAVATGLSILLRPAVPVAPHLASSTSPPTTLVPAQSTTGPFTAAALRLTVMEHGIDAMPSVVPSAGVQSRRPIPSPRNLDLGDPS